MSAQRLWQIQDHLKFKKGNSSDLKMSQSPLTTHVLNTAQGIPAAHVAVSVVRLEDKGWRDIATGVTNSDGRCPGLLTSENFVPGIYKMKFAVDEYWQSLKMASFYPYIEVVFNISDACQKYHIALLLSPFSYSTYRGS
ncbi:5-hydroxyisourate hydrolase isoform X1 [Stegostoma tigrinum]|uniref:5-hydroxyisourate hydrolase isoform X1 n=1 Tax=Stegostoma tigrinum TaxID=3053191 RepID=UPI00202B0DB6|nr:5-hydroxyisourate hydrolase isoform X1 [Stegostoma tigrinum]XP_048402803.1 5-hydroxyisourate hydrolase isoform X1 [Stegostoma tigrinum]XP_048402804.1 5-hydroxyisourate hydrolase isoform X1 [Stegostoma tigrinum]